MILESFNGRLREEILSSELFVTLAEARYLIDRWRLFYNHRRIQRPLGEVPRWPSQRLTRCYLRACKRQPTSTKTHTDWTDENDPVTRHDASIARKVRSIAPFATAISLPKPDSRADNTGADAI